MFVCSFVRSFRVCVCVCVCVCVPGLIQRGDLGPKTQVLVCILRALS